MNELNRNQTIVLNWLKDDYSWQSENDKSLKKCFENLFLVLRGGYDYLEENRVMIVAYSKLSVQEFLTVLKLASDLV